MYLLYNEVYYPDNSGGYNAVITYTPLIKNPPPPQNRPPAPSNFRTANSGGGTFTVAWDATFGNLLGSVAIWSPYGCGCYTDVPDGSTSYTFYNLPAGSWPCFIAYAHNSGGNSRWSEWACGYA
ncbi:MAG TPA: hypothetical protein VFA70_02190 [Dehalococcoidia bacterium]|nr:hypothetical protein [Dehalococcoidia bacterium]